MKPKRRRPGIEELLAVFNSLSDKDAGRLCDCILGLKIGTNSCKYDIISCITYDADVQAAAKGMSASTKIEAYYDIYLDALLNCARQFVGKPFCIDMLTIVSKEC